MKFWLIALLPFMFLACSQKPVEPVKALVILGGHDFDEPEFFDMFDSMAHVKYDTIYHPNANGIYGSPEKANYDVFVYYDMVQDITEEQKTAFMQTVEDGKGFVFLHHSICSYQQWDEYMNTLGGRYYLKDGEFREKPVPASTYKHNIDMNVHIVDKNHPITKGVENFTIHDEIYGGFQVVPTVHPLLTTDHPESTPTVGWTNESGNSKIAYLQLGHDKQAYANSGYRQLLEQAIVWAGQ